MAVTAAGTPYVESSDLVANYPGTSLALANHIDATAGKVLQVVRATDSTDRETTSTSYVDANISVTITPKKSDSVILILWIYNISAPSNGIGFLQITDSSNNALSGAESNIQTMGASTAPRFLQTQIGYHTPATTLAVTYKGRFSRTSTGTITLKNADNTGQMYAIEVAA